MRLGPAALRPDLRECRASLVDAIRAEGPGQRDIAFYVSDPHVVLAQAPQELFLDPSHTYRLDLADLTARRDGGRVASPSAG